MYVHTIVPYILSDRFTEEKLLMRECIFLIFKNYTILLCKKDVIMYYSTKYVLNLLFSQAFASPGWYYLFLSIRMQKCYLIILICVSLSNSVFI